MAPGLVFPSAVPVPEMALAGRVQPEPSTEVGPVVPSAVLRTRTATGALVVGLAKVEKARGVA